MHPASSPETSSLVICVDVLPVLRMTRMVGDSRRTRYVKSIQDRVGISQLRR